MIRSLTENEESVPASKLQLPCYKQIKHKILIFIQTIQVILQQNNIKYTGHLMRTIVMVETQLIYFSLQVLKQENTDVFIVSRLTVHIEYKHPKLSKHYGQFKQLKKRFQVYLQKQLIFLLLFNI